MVAVSLDSAYPINQGLYPKNIESSPEDGEIEDEELNNMDLDGLVDDMGELGLDEEIENKVSV